MFGHSLSRYFSAIPISISMGGIYKNLISLLALLSLCSCLGGGEGGGSSANSGGGENGNMAGTTGGGTGSGGGNAPVAPNGLKATVKSDTSIDLSWNDNSNNELGFRIERRMTNSSFNQIAELPTNTTAYSDVGLQADTVYLYRVVAFNAFGVSAYSNEASGRTNLAGLVPNAPSELVADLVSHTRIDLVWKDNSANETSFVIFTSNDGASWTELATVGSDVTGYSATRLTSDKKYYFHVVAQNSVGKSSPSNTDQTFTFKPPIAQGKCLFKALHPASFQKDLISNNALFAKIYSMNLYATLHPSEEHKIKLTRNGAVKILPQPPTGYWLNIFAINSSGVVLANDSSNSAYYLVAEQNRTLLVLPEPGQNQPRLINPQFHTLSDNFKQQGFATDEMNRPYHFVFDYVANKFDAVTQSEIWDLNADAYLGKSNSCNFLQSLSGGNPKCFSEKLDRAGLIGNGLSPMMVGEIHNASYRFHPYVFRKLADDEKLYRIRSELNLQYPSQRLNASTGAHDVIVNLDGCTGGFCLSIWPKGYEKTYAFGEVYASKLTNSASVEIVATGVGDGTILLIERNLNQTPRAVFLQRQEPGMCLSDEVGGIEQ